jgi:hypothetical protein
MTSKAADGLIISWAGEPDVTMINRIADLMDQHRGLSTSNAETPAPAPGPGPQTQLALEAMSTLRSVVAVRDREALDEQIAAEIERRSNRSFSIAGGL